MSDLLVVEDLHVTYPLDSGPVRAVQGVSFTLQKGQRLGLVGESGSGKSTTALALIRLLAPPGRVERGHAWLEGTDLVGLAPEAMRKVRFSRVSLIPQGAMNSLNPVMRIHEQFADTMAAHDLRLSRRDTDARIHSLLQQVGLPVRVAQAYPHELSGGMKQRVCIALAITLQPVLIIADEPTSALDVVVQRQVMETLGRVQAELGAAVILVGHDMGLMAQFVDTVNVMYAGRLVETGPVAGLLTDPRHPYTRLLIQSLPTLAEKRLFRGIPGVAPSLRQPPPGCPFHPRCPSAFARCSVEAPALLTIAPGRQAACHLLEVSA
jgi:peptide/nickel transport system ATP-binding protein